MANLDSGIEQWLNIVEQHTNISNGEKSEITGAGAKVFAESLKKNTPVSGLDYSKGKGRRAGHASKSKRAHLKDMITYEAGVDAEKEKTGNTVVGYDGKYFNFVAAITNNGKKIMSPKQLKNLHFVERSRQESEDKIQKAMQEKYRNIIEGKGNL